MLLQPDQEPRTELNRWFLTVAGSVDVLAAGVLLALAHRPDRTLLIVEHAGAAIVAGAIILPFEPTFAPIPAIGVAPLIAYPYWREVRTFPSWWAGVSRPLLILAGLAAAALLVTAAIAIPRQVGGTDRPALGGWWPDYAEHATVLALAGVLLHFWSASDSPSPPGVALNAKCPAPSRCPAIGRRLTLVCSWKTCVGSEATLDTRLPSQAAPVGFEPRTAMDWACLDTGGRV